MIYQFSCFVIAACSLLAVLHPKFDDTIAQRISLGLVCIFSLGAMTKEVHGPMEWLVVAFAAYCLETTRKIYMR
jgi:hypothetical protein